MKLICLLVGIVISSSILAQSIRISNFSVTEVGNTDVLVRWVMNAGSTCRTLEVERSVDKEYFKSVYSYPGVCGGESEAISYTWVDGTPLTDQVLYYRVKLTEGEYTLLDSILIVGKSTEDLITIFPNPSTSIFKVELSSESREAFQWELFSQNGSRVMQGNSFDQNKVEINLSKYKSGVYLFKWQTKDGRMETERLYLIK